MQNINIQDTSITEYCRRHSGRESSLLKAIRKDAVAFAPKADMCSDAVSGGLLRILARVKQPKNILEIGMFFGYATLCMAQGFLDTKITCLERDEKVIAIAKKYFKRYGPSSDCIKVVRGDAKVLLPKVLSENSFDFIFVDAEKSAYPSYVSLCCDHVPSGGVIVLDNALWKGGVCAPNSRSSSAIHKANIQLLQDKRFDTVLVPVRDGMHIAVKT